MIQAPEDNDPPPGRRACRAWTSRTGAVRLSGWSSDVRTRPARAKDAVAPRTGAAVARDLQASTSMTVNLAVREGLDVLYIEILSPLRGMRLPSRIGALPPCAQLRAW